MVCRLLAGGQRAGQRGALGAWQPRAAGGLPDAPIDHPQVSGYPCPGVCAARGGYKLSGELIGVADFLPLPGDLLEPQQRLADLFAAQGRIPATVDVTPAFDGRFNEVVAAAQEDA